jgi:outer membrane lipoprotein SlyB
MRGALAALLLAASQLAGAVPYAPNEYDFSDLCGTVEAVREVSIQREPAELAGVLEHAIQPETGEALVVRLDNGRLIMVMQEGMQRFRPGERVRLLGGRLLRT